MRSRDVHVHVRAAFTNTTAVDAYRGAGRPECAYVLERIVDMAAARLGMSPFEIRARNLIQPEQIPYRTPFLWTYDSGDLPRALAMARDAAELSGFAARRRASEAAGRLRGLGVSFYMEACGMGPSEMLIKEGCAGGQYEVAVTRVSPTGGITVLTGSHAHGQGHETAFAQIVADETGLDPAQIEIVHGDTARVPYGIGTYGSRSLAVGGSALLGSTRKVVAKMKRIAAHMLDSDPSEVVLEGGMFRVPGRNVSLRFAEVAGRAYAPVDYPEGLEPGLEETTYFDPEAFTFPYGCHIVEVEVDPDTGSVLVQRYLAVDDFGRLVNPMIVEGQIHGGAAQAIGQACLEGCRYDPELRPTPDRNVHGLCHAARDRRAGDRVPFLRDHLHHQSCRLQGLRRSRRDRRSGCDHQCNLRRSCPARRFPPRHAGDAGGGVAGDTIRRATAAGDRRLKEALRRSAPAPAHRWSGLFSRLGGVSVRFLCSWRCGNRLSA